MTPRYVSEEEASGPAWLALTVLLIVVAALAIAYFAWYAPNQRAAETPDVNIIVPENQPAAPDVDVDVQPPPPAPRPAPTPEAGNGEQGGGTTTQPENGTDGETQNTP